MSQVNFLPQSYCRKRRREKRAVYEIVVVMVVIAAMASWYQQASMSIGDLERQAEGLEASQRLVKQEDQQITRLKAEYVSLSKQVAVRREVTLPVTHTQIVATIAEAMPASIGLEEVNVRGERPAPKAVEATGDKKSKVDTRNKIRKKTNKAETNQHASIAIDLVGISPDDAKIADFVGRLADNALFQEVKLEYTRSAEVDRLIGRRFRVTMKVPTDCDYAKTTAGLNSASAPISTQVATSKADVALARPTANVAIRGVAVLAGEGTHAD